ncbi:MAG TPA: tRNA (adenosine(37)-N6)-dimethylallyltransferase MiaA [Polyangium sp.]|nr:tRNA (adenosine(37)-N6)-dimethylallyltransferase MiaA [Polyangium sp.]
MNDPRIQAPAPSWRQIEKPSDDELLVVVGPTATGKTELGIRLAETFEGEIISADSVQIYREYNIGSGKPTAQEQARAPHHLISVADPFAPIDAQTYAEMAERAIADIRRRGRVPIIVGGTFLWVKALVRGLMAAPPASAEIRARHAAFVEASGRAALHMELARVDPESAKRLSPNDFVRVSRALEVFELSGKKQSEWFAEHGFQEEKHRARLVGVAVSRDEQDVKIRARVERWMAEGWIEEVQKLLEEGHAHTRPMGSVGFKEVRAFVEGTLRRDELVDTIVRATRVFARRQRTWLRDEPVNYYALEGLG